ncbi:MAG: PilZ domain-containing protein [Candidatus Omnitrophota bacterium]
MTQENDRRIFERLRVDFSARIKPLQAKKAASAQCYDISAGGVGLFAKRILEPSAYLEIYISVLNKKIAQLPAEKSWFADKITKFMSMLLRALAKLNMPTIRINYWLSKAGLSADTYEKICFHSIGKIVWVAQGKNNKWRAGIEFRTTEFLKLNRFIELAKYSPQCNAL